MNNLCSLSGSMFFSYAPQTHSPFRVNEDAVIFYKNRSARPEVHLEDLPTSPTPPLPSILCYMFYCRRRYCQLTLVEGVTTMKSFERQHR